MSKAGVGPDQTVTTTPASRQWGQIRPSRWGQINLSQSPLVLPDVREQQDRLAHHLALKTSASRLQQEIQGQKARSTALRRAVLAAAFSGRLTGRSADAEIIEEIAES